MVKLTAKFYKGHDTRSRRVWPKYATQLLNIAGQNSRCFDAKRVGSMKELWLEFVDSDQPDTLENWEAFYLNAKGNHGLTEASQKLHDMTQKMGIEWVDGQMCSDYVHEVIFNKTHFGMGGESMAIAVAAEYFGLDYRFSNAVEESQGIDGWIGDQPVQVKPQDSYKVGHVFNKADTSKQLVVTYEKKKHTCYIHNPEFIQDNQ